MTKTKTIFACSKCGAQFPKWAGRCQECGSWGTLQEETVGETISSRPVVGRAQAVINLGEVKNKDLQRLLVNLPEFDRVLGGGLVRGSLILLGGDPGIGKSTIALQLAGRVPGSVYVSGEESAEQVGQRLQRINSKAQVDFIAETNLGNILATLEKTRPPLRLLTLFRQFI
jgi:DNA repair protein RadA/Sms